VVVKDSAASPLWARFYEIGTNRPISRIATAFPNATSPILATSAATVTLGSATAAASFGDGVSGMEVEAGIEGEQ